MILALLIAGVSALYATAGQAGGTGFVAVMALASFPTDKIRATTLVLNIAAAGYASARLALKRSIDWMFLKALLASSLPAAPLGGYIVLGGAVTARVTGLLLLAACVGLLVQGEANGQAPVTKPFALTLGAATGLASGLSGIGGGIFLAPALILFGRMSPTRVAGLSPPFIFANSIAGLAGIFLAGQRPTAGMLPLMVAAVAGSIVGTAIGLRWRSENMVRHVLAVVLAGASADLLF